MSDKLTKSHECNGNSKSDTGEGKIIILHPFFHWMNSSFSKFIHFNKYYGLYYILVTMQVLKLFTCVKLFIKKLTVKSFNLYSNYIYHIVIYKPTLPYNFTVRQMSNWTISFFLAMIFLSIVHWRKLKRKWKNRPKCIKNKSISYVSWLNKWIHVILFTD